MTFLSYNSFAQTQTISFESSEGYTLGTLSGQQNWVVWGGLYASDSQVVSTTFTAGARSMYVESYGDVMDYCGIEKPITAMNTNKYSISFDFKHEGFGGSDFQIDFYNVSATGTYSRVTAVAVGYAAGLFRYANMGLATPALVDTTTNIPSETWSNFKIVVDKTANNVEYFVNNVSVGTAPLGANKDVNLIDFTFDDYGTGFYVDNIVTADMSNLAVTDVEAKTTELSIYPNPSSDFVNVKTKEKVNSIEVFDLSGKLILKDVSGNNQLNIKSLEIGSYLVKVNTDKNSFTKKFIKK